MSEKNPYNIPQMRTSTKSGLLYEQDFSHGFLNIYLDTSASPISAPLRTMRSVTAIIDPFAD